MAYYLFNFTRKAAKAGVPLSDQAAELLECGLWGIGAKTPNRGRLAAGDRFLAFVGAPERGFVGHGTLAGGVHEWSLAEAADYPGDWEAGVALSEATVWKAPVPIGDIWPSMPSAAGNPNAQFFSGVVQVKQRDYELAVAAATGFAPEQAASATAPAPRPTAPSSQVLGDLYAIVEKLRMFHAESAGEQLTEEATRAHFVTPLLLALGYTGFTDIDYAVKVETGDVADYMLKVGGTAAIVVEAKRLGTKLDGKHAAQVIKYASVCGVRWGLLTNGQVMQLFDRVPTSPEDRQVFEIDLLDCADLEDFEVRLFPDLELLSKSALVDGSALERRAARKSVRGLLVSPSSATVQTLRKELADGHLAHLTDDELAELLEGLLSPL